MYLSPQFVIYESEESCLHYLLWSSWFSEECRNCRVRVDILKSLEYISDYSHFAHSSPHIATPTPTHQQALHLPLPTMKRRSYPGGWRREQDLRSITLPLLGQLRSETVATKITPHPSLTVSLCVPHHTFVLSVLLHIFICNFSLVLLISINAIVAFMSCVSLPAFCTVCVSDQVFDP